MAESRNSKDSAILDFFLESLESLYEYLKFGCFGQIGYFFHSVLGPGFDSDGRITKFQRFSDSGIFLESLESLYKYLKFGCLGQIGYFSIQF